MVVRIYLLIAAALILAGCGNLDVEGVRNLPNQGGKFHKALQNDYVNLAARERAEGDWPDTIKFVQRARRVAAGETIGPEATSARAIPAYALQELRDARKRLVAVLNEQVRGSMPAMASVAQTAYDCWIQEQEEDMQPDHISACRNMFNGALRTLEGARQVATDDASHDFDERGQMPSSVSMLSIPRSPPEFQVFFGFDSYKLDEQGRVVINAISSAIAGYRPTMVVLVGHTDSAGSRNYNMQLSRMRAQEVHDALMYKGTSAQSMLVEAYGEERPLVKQPDGTREPKNRRVNVTFKE